MCRAVIYAAIVLNQAIAKHFDKTRETREKNTKKEERIHKSAFFIEAV